MTRVRAVAVTGAALALLVSLANVASAQQAGVGVIGGLNVSEINVSGDESLNVLFVQQPSPVFGVAAGGPLAELIALEADALLSVKGSRLDINGRTDRIRLTYIDVPVIVRFGVTTGNGPHVQMLGGVYTSFLLDSSRTSDAAVPAVNIDNAFKSYDFGWVAGFGLGFGRSQFDIRYSGGILNISNDANLSGIVPAPASPDKFRNRGFSFVGAYRF